MWLYFRFSSERVKFNCVTHSVKFEYLYLRKLSMIRNKVVWDKHYYSNRFTVRNIFLLCYSRFRLICIFKFVLAGARCALGEMIVEVYRPTGYDGEAYLKTDRTKCKLVFVGMEHGMMKYQRNVAYTDTNCPLKMTKDTPTVRNHILYYYKYILLPTVDGVERL